MKKILIIEDDADVQKIYREELTRQGFEILIAENGQEGVRLAKTEAPDLILLDIMLLGGMNGFDVLEECQRQEALSKIPVIVLTNLDTEEEVAKKMGVVDYIVKTETTVDEVIEKIKKTLR